MPWKRASRLLLLRCMLNITNDPQRPREAKLNGGSLESTDIHACFCIAGPILSMLGEHRAHVLIFGDPCSVATTKPSSRLSNCASCRLSVPGRYRPVAGQHQRDASIAAGAVHRRLPAILGFDTRNTGFDTIIFWV